MFLLKCLDGIKIWDTGGQGFHLKTSLPPRQCVREHNISGGKQPYAVMKCLNLLIYILN